MGTISDYLNTSYSKGGHTDASLELSLVKQHQLLILAGTGRYLVFYCLDNILVLSVFRHYWNGLVIVLIHPGHSVVLSVVDVL